MGKRRPWILIAQSGMIVVLSSMLLIPNMSSNVTVVGVMFLVYNIFTFSKTSVPMRLQLMSWNRMNLKRSTVTCSPQKQLVESLVEQVLVPSSDSLASRSNCFKSILVVIMLVPLFMTERPGEKLSMGNQPVGC